MKGAIFRITRALTYEKAEYPPEELEYLHNQIEERAYVIERNLEKMGEMGFEREIVGVFRKK